MQLWLHPLFCGTPTPSDLIAHHAPEAKFRLTDVHHYDSDVIILQYQPV